MVDEVVIDGIHPAGLGVEQTYGYMVRNGIVYGILTTMKGWCFLRRINGGGLYITRMYGDFPAWQGISDGAVSEGYNPTTDFSIMKALYYMSYIADATPNLPETPANGMPGEVTLPRASSDPRDAAPTVLQPRPRPRYVPTHARQGHHYRNGNQTQGRVKVVGNYEDAPCSRYDDGVHYSSILFEPWNTDTCLGPKTWTAKVLPDETWVVLKLWDGWHCDTEARDIEASVYLHLRPLWGKYLPSLRFSGPIEFFHALVLQYVNVSGSILWSNFRHLLFPL
jgi:hypothetical protein